MCLGTGGSVSTGVRNKSEAPGRGGVGDDAGSSALGAGREGACTCDARRTLLYGVERYILFNLVMWAERTGLQRSSGECSC